MRSGTGKDWGTEGRDFTPKYWRTQKTPDLKLLSRELSGTVQTDVGLVGLRRTMNSHFLLFLSVSVVIRQERPPSVSPGSAPIFDTVLLSHTSGQKVRGPIPPVQTSHPGTMCGSCTQTMRVSEFTFSFYVSEYRGLLVRHLSGGGPSDRTGGRRDLTLVSGLS